MNPMHNIYVPSKININIARSDEHSLLLVTMDYVLCFSPVPPPPPCRQVSVAQETNSHTFSPDTGTFSVMSVSSLPEWKQLLLERKRREEEARERKEKQEEEKFASMPAWKRGIIQRRKAKQDNFGDREKERDVCLLPVDLRSPSDGLSDTDSCLTLNLGSEVSFSPDPGIWLDADIKPGNQVSVETIVPVHENPFMRTQSSWRKGREADGGSDFEIKEREKDKSTCRSQEGESGKGRDIEFKIERFRDLSAGRDRSQGRERDNSKGRWEKEKSQWKDSVKDPVRESLKLRKDEEDKEKNPSSSSLGPCLRTIRADNIIIIEQDRKGSDERKGRWRDTERERPEEDHQGKRGMKMDLRDIFAVGGNVTEIRASEVLIIKPSESSEERNATGGVKGVGREDAEMKAPLNGRWESTARELKTDMSWLREKEKERPWGQATVIKEDRKDSMDDSVFVDRGGRVSQLLSKFGQHPKPPSRSKSSDNFLRPGRRTFSEEEDEHQSEGNGRGMLLKGTPKRSFSFSERAICANENGLDDNGYYEKKTRERSHSEKDLPPWVDAARLSNDAKSNFKLGCARLLDKDRLARFRERHLKTQDNVTADAPSEVWKTELVHAKTSSRVEDDGFTVATVKNTEGISFAKRVPIRQEGRAKETNRLAGETVEGKASVEKEPAVGGQLIFDKKAPDFWRENAIDSTAMPDTAQRGYAVAASSELSYSGNTTHSLCRHGSAFTECLSMHCSVTDRPQDHLRASEWSSAGPQRPYSVLSQHTEDLISKIEKIGDTTVYNNEKGDRLLNPAYEVRKDTKEEGQMQSKPGSENPTHDVAPRSPKKVASIGITAGPLEIQIPRSVFYVAEDLENKKADVQTSEGQSWEGGTQVERRDSWRIGKPLSRIESLREKIRQRELEKRRQREEQDEVCGGNAETIVSHAAGDWQDEKGTEKPREAENAAEIRNKLCDAESSPENAAILTSTTAFDVTQEVSVLQTYPQLPPSVPHSQADLDEEARCQCVTATSEIVSDSFHTEDNLEENDEQHFGDFKEDKDQLKELEANQEDSEDEEDEEVEEEAEEQKGLSEEESQECTSSHQPDSLADMSRIYNLEKIGSRSGLCLTERPVDRPSVHLVTVRPLVPSTQQRENKTYSGDDKCGVQAIQRQIEQFQMREEKVLKTSTSPSILLKGKESKGLQSPKGLLKHQATEDTSVQKNDRDTSILKTGSQRVLSPTSQLKQQQNQTVCTSPTALRSQSPDNTLKPSDYTPTPASSPMSPSPVQSPSVSPSPSPSPTLFTIRSASGGGGKGKRGATITITPRKPAGSEEATAVSGSTTATVATPGKTVSQQAQTTSTTVEPSKKKYPTVEEIEVIGGYQSLERSCLAKNRGTPKKVSGGLQKRDNYKDLCAKPKAMKKKNQIHIWGTYFSIILDPLLAPFQMRHPKILELFGFFLLKMKKICFRYSCGMTQTIIIQVFTRQTIVEKIATGIPQR